MSKPTKNTHGGSGRGQGRKTIGNEPLEPHTVSVSAQDWKYLQSIGKSASEGLREVIRFYKEHKR